jgi:hypothetical protein
MPISIELPWKHYPSRVKQDDVRSGVIHRTLKIPKRPEVVFGWKLATLEETYSEDNMP